MPESWSLQMIKPKTRWVLSEILLMIGFLSLFFLASNGFDFLIWLVNVPLLILVYGKSWKRAAVLSLICSVLAVTLSFTWAIKYSFVVYIASTVVFSTFLFLFAVSFNLLSKRINNFLRIFIAPFVYLILMIVFSFTLINSYWAQWSMFQPMMAPLIWIIGSEGLTFMIILVHSLLAFLIMKFDRKLFIITVLIALLLLFNFAYSSYSVPDGKKIKVALLQGNFDRNWEWRSANAYGAVFNAYENMTLEASKQNPDLIIWPEYSIANDILKNDFMFKRLSSLAKKSNSTLIIGTLKWNDSFYRKERHRYDTALIIGRNGSLMGSYDSVNPIPFEKSVLKGTEAKVLEIDAGAIGISLCYEETQKLAKAYSSEGAELLISLSNNLQLDNTAGLHLISLYSNLDAAENGKYLVRTTNTGITKIVNPFGKVEQQLKPYTRGILIGDVYLSNKATFYTKYGSIILELVLILLWILFYVKIKKSVK